LAAQALLLGLAHVLVRIAGNTLFLIHYGAESIPFIYLTAGILGPLAGLLLTRLGKHIRLSYLLTYSLGLSLLVLLGLRIAISQQPALSGTAGLVLFVWVYLQAALLGLGFGALTGRLLDARQSRRLGSLLTGGEASGRILGGLGAAMAAAWLAGSSSFTIGNMLIAAAIAIAGVLILLAYLLPHPALSAPARSPGASPDQRQNAVPQEGKESWKNLSPPFAEITPGVLKARYVRLLTTLTIFALVGYFFVDQIYQFQAIDNFPTLRRLLIFLGLFEVLLSAATLLGRLAVGRPLVRRFGLLAGLLALPVATTLGVLPLAIAGLIWGSGVIFLWLAVLTKFFMVVFRRAIEHPAERILFQPLPDGERAQAQAFISVIVEPGSAALAGFLLLILPGSATLLAFILVAILVLWALAATFIGQEYHNKLTNALTGRSLSSAGFNTADASSLAVLARGLQSPNLGQCYTSSMCWSRLPIPSCRNL
jgi:ATP/ADP translocase